MAGARRSAPAVLPVLIGQLKSCLCCQSRLKPCQWCEATRAVVSLPGGTFLMGTDYERGFPADGEGPVRQVSVSALEIDTHPVTNADFAEFIAATQYQTEAELFGWSFVFWAHIPSDRFEELVEDTAAATPWWCKVPGATWDKPEGPGSRVQRAHESSGGACLLERCDGVRSLGVEIIAYRGAMGVRRAWRARTKTLSLG